MKKQNIKISKRLKTIADLVIDESLIVDVGVDSGNLDIYLAQNSKKLKKIFAVEEKKKPYANLVHNIEYFCVSKKVFPILNNCIPNEKFSCLIIAGLGCYTIWEILEKYSLNKLKNSRVILAPQGSQVEFFILKKRLSKVFDINTILVKENKKFYEILDLKKKTKKVSDIDLMFNLMTSNLKEIEEYMNLKKKEMDVFFKYYDSKKLKENSFEELKNKKNFKEFYNYEN